MRTDSECDEELYWKVVTPHETRFNDQIDSLAHRWRFVGVRCQASTVYYISGNCTNTQIESLVALFIDEPFCAPSRIECDNEKWTKGIVVETALRAGVTDRVGMQLTESARQIGLTVNVSTGSRFEVHCEGELGAEVLDRLVRSLFCNPIIETWSCEGIHPSSLFLPAESQQGVIDVVPIRHLSNNELMRLNQDRGLALDEEEILVLRDWFQREGRDPTDAELETLAQTWSEHCCHKTFTAEITTTDGSVVEPLLAQLRKATKDIDAPFVVSAFDGNAGIVHFAGGTPLAIKVETHNHPSAVEPFGGANTGVGGVIRDVLAAPARPVALTNVLCFGPRNTQYDAVPLGMLHPSVIEDGVVAGVSDYGNKMGIPTVAGAVLYDAGYIANPLVFCGCVGEVLEGYSSLGKPRIGDVIVVIGGATGRDGIKGATFSSMTMDATTGEVAGASVQIGDPIIERLVGEVLITLLDRPDPLCTALTDCGAGGLSSAIGEMAESIGARVQLDNVARKYHGLDPWEVWLSEAQERMVLAVNPGDVEDVLRACESRGVGASVVGVFTGDDRLRVFDGDRIVVDLPTALIHEGRPRRRLVADISGVENMPSITRHVEDHQAMLLSLLAHPTIASKEVIIRQYDHEILGSTVVGPMSAPMQTGPSDGVVICEPRQNSGFAIGIGVNPQYGLYDAEKMAWSAVDEAIRNVVVAGANPSRVALLDNFSWGDPRRASTLGDLVLAVRGCCEAARTFRAPFVSGKDSLNNEYQDGTGQSLSIPPTLVITAVASVDNADHVVTTSLSNSGNVIVLLGDTTDELRGSHLDLLLGDDFGGGVPGKVELAPSRYATLHQFIERRMIKSAHDCSEGGLIVALGEMAMTTHFGLEVHLDVVHENEVVALYAESNSRIMIEVSLQSLPEILAGFGTTARVIGEVTERSGLVVDVGEQHLEWSRTELLNAWNTHV